MAAAKSPKRVSWLDEEGGVGIEEHARRLTSFVAAMADGAVSAPEVAAQERRVVALMREVEPLLDDALHARITALLCELTAFDIMQLLHEMQTVRPRTQFRG